MTGYDTSPSGLSAAGSKADSVLRDAKAGSAKGTSGTYSDRPEAPHVGPGGISSRNINKPATPRPSGSTADTGRKQP
jgi:hypothetical protein